MEKIFTLSFTAVSGFAVGCLIGVLHTLRTYPRQYVHLTGSSFHELYEDNEPIGKFYESQEYDEMQEDIIHFNWAAECM